MVEIVDYITHFPMSAVPLSALRSGQEGPVHMQAQVPLGAPDPS